MTIEMCILCYAHGCEWYICANFLYAFNINVYNNWSEKKKWIPNKNQLHWKKNWCFLSTICINQLIWCCDVVFADTPSHWNNNSRSNKKVHLNIQKGTACKNISYTFISMQRTYTHTESVQNIKLIYKIRILANNWHRKLSNNEIFVVAFYNSFRKIVRDWWQSYRICVQPEHTSSFDAIAIFAHSHCQIHIFFERERRKNGNNSSKNNDGNSKSHVSMCENM